MTIAPRFVLTLWAALAVGCATAPVARLADAEDLVIVDVTVVDGRGGAPLLHQDVEIVGGRIRGVVPTGGTHNARTLDGRGKTLLPGFVDAHTHITGSGVLEGEGLDEIGNLNRYALAGVTTVFDTASPAPQMSELAERIELGTITGPRLFHTHLMMCGKDAHPIPLVKALSPLGFLAAFALPQIENDDDIAAALDEADDLVVDFVKIGIDRMPSDAPALDRDLMTRAVREAKKRGHLVFVHAGDVDDAVAAAEAGADVLTHLPWHGEITPDKARALRKSGVMVTTTASMWESMWRAALGGWSATEKDKELIPAPMISGIENARVNATLKQVGTELRDQSDQRKASLQALLDAQVPLLIGTDAGLPAIWAGSALHNEVQFLAAHGVPMAELIVALTSRPAQLIAGKNADFGVVAEGFRADLVVVDGDPFADPAALLRVSTVLRDGRVVERVTATP
jgi:imidazolonepropionase-like amidohydrolase